MLPNKPEGLLAVFVGWTLVAILDDPTEDEDECTPVLLGCPAFLAAPLLMEASVDIALVEGFRDMSPGADGKEDLVAEPLTSFSNSAIGSREMNSLPPYCTTTYGRELWDETLREWAEMSFRWS